jgi:ADP-ribose pyrophosphatase YjhB (NUDIX family)
VDTKVRRIHLCSGLLERHGSVLLVASRYPNLPEPLWNLPGGRQRDGELLVQALAREWREETGLDITDARLLYLSESHDGASDVHFLNACFSVKAGGEPRLPAADAHVVDLAWVPRAELPRRLLVPVVREPLLAYLGGDRRRYYGFDDAGITIEFADDA